MFIFDSQLGIQSNLNELFESVVSRKVLPKMDELLPNEILCLIFSNLNLSDLFNSLRLVNKRFNWLVNSMKFEELVFSNFSECNFKNSWYFTYRPVNAKAIIYADYLEKIISSPSFASSFANLRSLKIDFGFLYYDMYFDIEHFNSFSKLEHLQFDNFMFRLNRNACLRLPALRILRVSLGFPTKELEIDAVRLEVLCCNLHRTRIKHPLSLKFLHQINQEIKDLRKFANLEIYKSTTNGYGEEEEDFDNDVLLKLPSSLKQLHFEDYRFDDLKGFVMAFFRERHRIDRSSLKLFFNGVELVNDRPFAEYRFERLIDFHQKNNRQMIAVPWCEEINFEELTSAYRTISPHFTSKFNNIQKILAGKIDNQGQFISFLKECNNLSSLVLNRISFLDQQFFDELPALKSSLFRLEMRENFDVPIDFRFIGRFDVMAVFLTDQHMPTRLALNSFEKVKFLNFFSFKNYRKTMEISKFSRKKLVISPKCETREWNFSDFLGLSKFLLADAADQKTEI